MATSLNSILDANPDLSKRRPAEGAQSTFSHLVDLLSKVGQRHGKKDKALVQTAHDALAGLVEGVHCAAGGEQEKAQNVSKRNMRHSKKDLATIDSCHALMKELGANCPGDYKETGND